MLKDVYDASKPGKLTAFGKAQLACGTGVFDSDWIILVEGRADVINLLRAGFDNAIAIEGAKIDEAVIKLTEGKKVIAFLDGDRAGDLILKELHGVVKIDKVLRAPQGREVEECTPLEIAEILREGMLLTVTERQEAHMSTDQKQQSERRQGTRRDTQEHAIEVGRDIQNGTGLPSTLSQEVSAEILSAVRVAYPQINETLEALVFDGSMKILLKVPVSDVVKKLDST